MILELMQKRRSIRKFTSEIPSKEILTKLIRAAIAAPSAGNLQPWRFVITQNQDVIELAVKITDEERHRLSSSIRNEYREDFNLYSENFLNFKHAPALIVPVYRKHQQFMRYINESEREEDRAVFDHLNHHSNLMSISCAIQNLLLMAESSGLGACCMTGALICGNRLNHCFHIPNGWHIAAIIPVGYPDENPGPVQRKQAETIIRWI